MRSPEHLVKVHVEIVILWIFVLVFLWPIAVRLNGVNPPAVLQRLIWPRYQGLLLIQGVSLLKLIHLDSTEKFLRIFDCLTNTWRPVLNLDLWTKTGCGHGCISIVIVECGALSDQSWLHHIHCHFVNLCLSGLSAPIQGLVLVYHLAFGTSQ